MNMQLLPLTVECPCCGESIEVLVDPSAGDQQYIEDCQVCCRPIVMTVSVDDDGEVQLDARAEDDA
ncbi:MAG: CPXCG motif-containing cysteine-rich protein [Rhodanobacter sp.]|jgi:hypothetical protein|nr:CPXCG motif-containing cysteine-rich protein [Rhodanobacter sp.]